MLSMKLFRYVKVQDREMVWEIELRRDAIRPLSNTLSNPSSVYIIVECRKDTLSNRILVWH